MKEIISLKNNFDSTTKTIHNALLNFNIELKKIIYEKFKNVQEIGFEDMSKFELNKKYELPTLEGEDCQLREGTCGKKIYFTLKAKTENELNFIVDFGINSTLVPHRHNDCDEIISVVHDDIVIVYETNGETTKRALKKGDVYTVKAGRKHQITSFYGKEIPVKFVRL